MNDVEARCLEVFPGWLSTLGDDSRALAPLLGDERLAVESREAVAGGLNYIFRSLDLIPDGIDDIGYLDDAFVLRVAAELACTDEIGCADEDAPAAQRLRELAGECGLIREFLGTGYARLGEYVRGLRRGVVRGRAVPDIVANGAVRRDFLADLHGFSKTYEAPNFSREEKTLIRLRAFFDAKLPR